VPKRNQSPRGQRIVVQQGRLILVAASRRTPGTGLQSSRVFRRRNADDLVRGVDVGAQYTIDVGDGHAFNGTQDLIGRRPAFDCNGLTPLEGETFDRIRFVLRLRDRALLLSFYELRRHAVLAVVVEHAACECKCVVGFRRNGNDHERRGRARQRVRVEIGEAGL